MDHLHIQKAKVACYSMGGMIVTKAEFKEQLLAALQASSQARSVAGIGDPGQPR